MLKMRSILLVLALGCGGSSPKPAVQAPAPSPAPDVVQKPPAPECAAVADKVASLMAQADTDAPAASIKARTDAVKNRCEADRWSAEARECLATADNGADAEGCAKLLTEAQLDAVDKDVDAAAPAAAAPPAAEAPADEAAPRRSRGGIKKPPPPKSSSDPCMGGE